MLLLLWLLFFENVFLLDVADAGITKKHLGIVCTDNKAQLRDKAV